MNKKPLKKEFNLFYATVLAAILVASVLLIPVIVHTLFDPTFIWFRPQSFSNEQLFFSLNV